MAQRQRIARFAVPPVLLRFLKFSLVGGLGVLVNSGILVALYEHLGLALVPASIVAVEAAIVHNFFWNNYWTFGAHEVSLDRFAKYNLTSVGGLIITTATLYGLVALAGMHYLEANLVGIGLATVWNFGLNATWTWRWHG